MYTHTHTHLYIHFFLYVNCFYFIESRLAYIKTIVKYVLFYRSFVYEMSSALVPSCIDSNVIFVVDLFSGQVNTVKRNTLCQV